MDAKTKTWVNAADQGPLHGKTVRFASDHKPATVVNSNRKRSMVRYAAQGGGEWQGWFDNSSLEIKQ